MERDKKQTYHIQWTLEIYFKINVDLCIYYDNIKLMEGGELNEEM